MERGPAVTRGSRVPEALSSFFERGAGGLTGPEGAAAGTVQTFSAVSIGTTIAFTLRYQLDPAVPSGPMVWLSTLTGVLCVVSLVLVLRGRQLAGAVVYLAATMAGMLHMAFLVGWMSGHHLYLITAAQLVFLMFTDRQRAWRWLFVVISAGSFMVAQLVAPAVGPQAPIGELGGIFAVNAVGTATLMFVLSVVAHYRAQSATLRAEALAAQAAYLANTDPLTGLANRRPVAARLDELAAAADGEIYAVAIADLDRFKALNDQHGHACGDTVLAAVGERMRGQLRVTDALGRWGGEEFIFVLAGTDLDEAHVMMERMRHLVGDRAVICGDHFHRITMSVGISDSAGDRVSHRVVKRADDALYEAKQTGRDRVVGRGAPAAGQAPRARGSHVRRGGE